MRYLYPESLADKSWDNTGLLLEAPIPSQSPRKANSVLLTIDLTKAVADEAIDDDHSVVVAYHPIIFRGLKAITLDNSQQQTLLRLASHGISVYCPHTAVDHVPDGMADWLCDIVTGKIEPAPEPQAFTAASEEGKPSHPPPSDPASEVDVTTSEEEETSSSAEVAKATQKASTAKSKRPSAVHRTYSKPSYPSRNRDRDSSSQRSPSPIQSSPTTTFRPSVKSHKRSVISPVSASDLTSANSDRGSSTDYYTSQNTGSGRLITFDTPQPLSSLITRIAHATGTPKGFPVAIPQDRHLESIEIKTVGICPGSGSSVISKCRPAPDLVFTGEVSHHEALAVIERGGCVISLFHSNSERGYLDAVMGDQLEQEIQKRWKDAISNKEEGQDDKIREILADESISVVVSGRDRDPFGIVVLQESRIEGEAVG